MEEGPGSSEDQRLCARSELGSEKESTVTSGRFFANGGTLENYTRGRP